MKPAQIELFGIEILREKIKSLQEEINSREAVIIKQVGQIERERLEIFELKEQALAIENLVLRIKTSTDY